MKMPASYKEFLASLHSETLPDGWPAPMQALWWDAKGEWHKAHDLVDGSNAAGASWIHAYLHRKEGDEWNAGYWYRRAGKPFPNIGLEEESIQLVNAQLAI